ncbi:HK97-gp10 family putative phage morphogenesis protein [Erythrobacter sp. R86502]|uniref:HK97-gp10 family putative phage morphogenesis protein n=1 Tax=Erythrobacter sp. R86502 TaxID=3093846 RepID=UPI0036D3D55F
MTARFDIGGFDELEKMLKELGPEIGTKAGQIATRKAGQFVAKKVRAAAPVGDGDTSRTYTTAAGPVTVDYGHLKRNIKVQKKRKNRRKTVGTIIGTGNAFWGRFLEFGTRKMAARPWFGPAMKSASGEALNVMKTELRKAITKLGRGR